ncbi:MAG: DUF3131 domain-containing protein [bacterium]
MRNHFLLILALFLHLNSCGVLIRGVGSGVGAIANSGLFHQGRHGALTEQEKKWGAIAWVYFENNYNPQTGLVNSVDRYPSTTLWHIGDYLAALNAAYAFELINKCEFDERLSTLLHFLNTMDLFWGRLPNKNYHTINGSMMNYSNQPEEVGWSALDIGRMLIWLKITHDRHPQYGEYIDRAVLRWSFCDVIDSCGTLYGGSKVHDKLQLYQEGRLGYEEYAARGFRAWGFNTATAASLKPYDKVKIYGRDVYIDARDPRQYGTQSPLVTLPFTLYGMEYEWDRYERSQMLLDDLPAGYWQRKEHKLTFAQVAEVVYKVQEQRYRKECIFTARTDHQLSTAPFFVYDAIFASGYAWNTISDAGDTHPKAALVSTRAAFGMWALWKTKYTDKLMGLVSCLNDPERGWYEGRFESTGGSEETITATTNALVLEALLFKKNGAISRYTSHDCFYANTLQDVFKHPGKCFPSSLQSTCR